MTRTYSAGGSRHSAVLVAIIGLHVGLFLVIASGLVPRVREAIEGAGPIYVPILQPGQGPRHEPGDPVLADPYYLPVQEPPLELPEFRKPDEAPAGATAAGADQIGAVSVVPASGEYVAATLRTRRDRVNVLVDSCYPAGARRDNEEGKAVARIVLGVQGSVLSWSVANSSGFPRLDAAMDCVVRRLAFEPARRDGTAIGSEVLLPIAFRLD